MKELYEMLLKRKSIRKFDNSLKLTQEELNLIKEKLKNLKPLIDNIDVAYKIVKTEETNCKWNGEYCLLVYSQTKDNYLFNIGYMLEQLDLYMASINIGACWYGWGKTDEKVLDGKDFVIMMNFSKCRNEDFRSDLKDAKRNDLDSIWKGDFAKDIGQVARYAPSAMNSQPWLVETENNSIKVFRKSKLTSILIKSLGEYFNKIDVGIFLCFLEVALEHFGFEFKRKVIKQVEKSELPIATYTIINLE